MSILFLLLTPPLAFVAYLLLSLLFSKLVSYLAAKGQDSPGKLMAYASGENTATNRAQPDYAQFFPFAFFFTVMHVTVLIVATVPSTPSGMEMVIPYLIVALLSVTVLLRKPDEDDTLPAKKEGQSHEAA